MNIAKNLMISFFWIFEDKNLKVIRKVLRYMIFKNQSNRESVETMRKSLKQAQHLVTYQENCMFTK